MTLDDLKALRDEIANLRSMLLAHDEDGNVEINVAEAEASLDRLSSFIERYEKERAFTDAAKRLIGGPGVFDDTIGVCGNIVSEVTAAYRALTEPVKP